MEKYNAKERFTGSGRYTESFKNEVVDYAKRYVDHVYKENEELVRRAGDMKFEDDTKITTNTQKKGKLLNWFRKNK